MKPLVRLLLLLCSPYCTAQTPEIFTSGKVTDAVTSKGLVARISYKSVPTGSIHGSFIDSTYQFEIFGTARYKVTAEADGYYANTVIVDPDALDESRQLVKNIMLIPRADKIILSGLLFAQGKASIESSSFQQLNSVAEMMTANKTMVIQLEGHTDNQGDPAANMTLSQRRVEAVKKFLVGKGIGKERIKTKAFGGSQPLGNELTQQDRAKNRRVEMRILKD